MRNFFFFWLGFKACEILVPWPGIEPTPPAVVVWSLNHWTARQVKSYTCAKAGFGLYRITNMWPLGYVLTKAVYYSQSQQELESYHGRWFPKPHSHRARCRQPDGCCTCSGLHSKHRTLISGNSSILHTNLFKLCHGQRCYFHYLGQKTNPSHVPYKETLIITF